MDLTRDLRSADAGPDAFAALAASVAAVALVPVVPAAAAVVIGVVAVVGAAGCEPPSWRHQVWLRSTCAGCTVVVLTPEVSGLEEAFSSTCKRSRLVSSEARDAGKTVVVAGTVDEATVGNDVACEARTGIVESDVVGAPATSAGGDVSVTAGAEVGTVDCDDTAGVAESTVVRPAASPKATVVDMGRARDWVSGNGFDDDAQASWDGIVTGTGIDTGRVRSALPWE